jgi:hypothetical protein
MILLLNSHEASLQPVTRRRRARRYDEQPRAREIEVTRSISVVGSVAHKSA